MKQEKWITETTEVMLLMKLPFTCKKGHFLGLWDRSLFMKGGGEEKYIEG